MTHPKPTMTGPQLREWMKYRGYNFAEAALVLGVGLKPFLECLKRMIVPEIIRLAVIGYEAERNQPITPEGREAIAKMKAIQAIITGDG